MLSNKILKSCTSLVSQRFINRSAKLFESKVSDSASKTSSSSASTSNKASSNGSHFVIRETVPSSFDKFILVWTKKYPKGQVPDRVKEEVIYQAKSRARVKVANYMIALTVIACIGFAYSGKQAAKRGDSIQKRNLDWHKQLKEEHEAKLKTESSS